MFEYVLLFVAVLLCAYNIYDMSVNKVPKFMYIIYFINMIVTLSLFVNIVLANWIN